MSQCSSSASTIISLQDQFESIRREVLARYRRNLGVLTVDQEEALKALTRSIVNKIADLPISEIKQEAVANNGDQEDHERRLLSAVRQIFRLSNEG